VSDLPPEIPNVAIRDFCIAARRALVSTSCAVLWFQSGYAQVELPGGKEVREDNRG
jgi:hypothetical protein